MIDRLKVLFLCTGNSCRSQMAEGWARSLKVDLIDAYSAGTDPHGMNPRAVQAMAEAGVEHYQPSLKARGQPEEHRLRLCGDGLRPCERNLSDVSGQDEGHPRRFR